MASLCSLVHDTALELMLFLRRADLEDHAGNFAVAVRLAGRAWVLARSGGNLKTEVDALRTLAWVLTRSGRNRRARAVYGVALRKADRLEAPVRAAILSEAALVQIKVGDYPAADRDISRAKRLLPVDHKIQEYPYLCIAEAFVQRRRGDIKSAQRNLDEARRFFKERGDYLNSERAGFQLSTLSALGGDLGGALCGLRRAMNAARRAGYLRLLAACQNEIAYGIARQIGDLRWAWGASQSAIALSEPFGNEHVAAIYMDSQVQLLIDEGRLEEAMRLVTTVLDTLQPALSSTSQYFESLARRGVIWLGMGDYLKAVEDLEVARDAQARMDDLLALVDTLTYLALAYHRAGSLNSAVDISAQAVRVLEQIGCANHQPQRVFWNHYLIARASSSEDASVSLRRAVELLESQASTLSSAQQSRFRSRVQLNQQILDEWCRAGTRPRFPDAPV
ncbi:MAG: hypothetical protein A2Z07_10855 [Armatimonadetes bacterium RBG_16_67_12]|nr:MAG: hypothetical protein A2Z07_10855 [Armatimonadetes bacterium RBG_16_67_12]